MVGSMTTDPLTPDEFAKFRAVVNGLGKRRLSIDQETGEALIALCDGMRAEIVQHDAALAAAQVRVLIRAAEDIEASALLAMGSGYAAGKRVAARLCREIAARVQREGLL
ncbi:hypothetical protein IP70_15740 [alpha proteobacterium AAP38]|nr:hypothetical protein IP70_15740 [alpha proteobacterium AAP38]